MTIEPDQATFDEAHREYLLQALRSGALRARLAAAEIDEIGVALKTRMISPDMALDWITHEFGVDRWCFPDEAVKNGGNQ